MFEVPRCSAGKALVSELARLFRAVGQGSALESVALKAVFVACSLLLQRTNTRSKPTDDGKVLGERMTLWKNGDLLELLHEGRTIQSRLQPGRRTSKPDHSSHVFAKLMFEGKTKAALQLLAGKGRGGILNLDDDAVTDPPIRSVWEVLRSKYPTAQPLHLNCLLPNWADPPATHPVIFDPLDGHVIRAAALGTSGAAGPSGVDAHSWRRLFTSLQLSCVLLFPCLLNGFVPPMFPQRFFLLLWLVD